MGLIDEFPDTFEEMRGVGLMLGLRCKRPNIDVVQAGYQSRILTVPGGQNVVRLLPPLNLTDDEIGEGLARLRAAATALREVK